MLGYYPFSIRNMMSWRKLGGGEEREVVGYHDVLVAQANARDWLDLGPRAAHRRWRMDALNLAMSGAVPALGLLLFDWSSRAVFAAFLIDLLAAWFWDVARMMVATHACEHELRRVLGLERALEIARAALRRRGNGAIEIRRELQLDSLVPRFALGYVVLAFATLCVLGVPIFFMVRDAMYGIWPHPLWPVFIPAITRSIFAIAELRAVANGRDRDPQVLPQAIGQSFSILFAYAGVWGVAMVLAKLDFPPLPDLLGATTYLVSYGIAAAVLAWLLAAQVREGRSELTWFVGREAETLVARKVPRAGASFAGTSAS